MSDTHVSASQLKTFMRCNRKWWYEYVAGIKMPASVAQQTGTELHEQIQNFYTSGVEPEHGSTRASLGNLPEPHAKVSVECEIDAIIDDVHIRGFIDLLDLSDADLPHVIDHKTSKTFRYALKEADLKTDIQMMKYAKWVLEFHAPGARKIRVSHNQIVYAQNGGAPRFVSTVVTREHVEEQWQRILAIVTELNKVRSLDKAAKVTPNWDACNDYGGCPHKSKCSVAFTELSSEEIPMKTFEENLPLESVNYKTRPKSEVLKMHTETSEGSLEYLFINAIPAAGFGEYTLLSTLLEPICKQLARETGLGDFRLVEYGRGRGMIVSALRQVELPRILVVGREDVSSIALEALIPRAKRIIQGV